MGFNSFESSVLEETFADLLSRARRGDESAKKRLFVQLGAMGEEGGRLRALARRLLGRRDRARRLIDSQDLVQSALRAGWLELAGFRGRTERELVAWISQILRHKLHRAVRRKRSWAGLDAVGDEDFLRLTRSQQRPMSELIQNETRLRLRHAIEELAIEQQQVLELRLRGYRSPEIAKILGVNPDTVRKRESRAVARLRDVLCDSISRG